MSIILVGTFVPDPASRAELIRTFEEVIVAVQSEPGCQLYALQENDDCLVMIEKWADQAALDAHRQGEPVKQLRPALAGVQFEVRELAAHPVGTAEQGAL